MLNEEGIIFGNHKWKRANVTQTNVFRERLKISVTAISHPDSRFTIYLPKDFLMLSRPSITEASRNVSG